jgi:hypothetical protein
LDGHCWSVLLIDLCGACYGPRPRFSQSKLTAECLVDLDTWKTLILDMYGFRRYRPLKSLAPIVFFWLLYYVCGELFRVQIWGTSKVVDEDFCCALAS